jgi:hypothetical protein
MHAYKTLCAVPELLFVEEYHTSERCMFHYSYRIVVIPTHKVDMIIFDCFRAFSSTC